MHGFQWFCTLVSSVHALLLFYSNNNYARVGLLCICILITIACRITNDSVCNVNETLGNVTYL